MRLTIIPIDSAVYKDEVCAIYNLSKYDIPLNVHALQWYDTRGWIEYIHSDPFSPRAPNEMIDVLPQWALDCAADWENQNTQTGILEVDPSKLSSYVGSVGPNN